MSRATASPPLRHLPILVVLLLHFALALTYAGRVPLGEAPDEPAHLSYARFIAAQGRLPATQAERQEAGYRSAWPPLYHFLVAGPLAFNGDAPPTRLKAVGDSPRRLIPTNGQTIAAFIHTNDETPPWRGLPLAWHLGRLVSVALTTLAVTLTYAIAWRLTRQHLLATGATAWHAFIPQPLFIGSSLNDDNLLICLAGFIFLTLINYTRHPGRSLAFLLGALLGLATIAKYNALPLWAFTLAWLFLPSSAIRRSLSTSCYLLIGAVLTAGWWFNFIWLNFNQVDRLGWLPGSLAALSAGTSDASLRKIVAGDALASPPASAWLEWFVTLFETFWGSFGGGSAIDLPAWIYGLLAIICLLAVSPYVLRLASCVLRHVSSTSHLTPHASRLFASSSPSRHLSASFLRLFLLSPLFFLPLPMIRFALTGSLVETAQGRHLFPALPAIALGLVWGLSRFTRGENRPLGDLRFPIFISPFSLPLLLCLLSFYSLNLIQTSYPPPIPLRTTPDAASAATLLNEPVAESITLVGYELGKPAQGVLPVTLVWRADAIPPEDYLIELNLTGETGQSIGGWLGQPLGGRYPTRAWDEGDVLRHTIPVPWLSNRTPTATLTLRLLDSFNQPTTATPVILATHLPIFQSSNRPTLQPANLRADGLPPGSPFTYRSTLSFVLADTQPPQLIAPGGQTISPTYFLPGSPSSIAHFIVAANWPSGDYQLPRVNAQWSIANRPRQFELPSMQYSVKANFANTLTLLGYDLPQRRVESGGSFPLTLHWRAERTMGQHLVVFNHLLNQENTQYGGADRIPQLYYTTWLWVPGEIVSDVYNVPVVAGAPPGVYWLDVGLYPSDQPTFSLPFVVDGQPIDRNSVRLGPFKVGGPPPGLTVSTIQPQNPLHLTFGDQITLLGFDLNVKPSNLQRLTLFWRAERLPAADYTVFVHLLNPTGNLVAQFDSPPAGGAYPTSLWEPGEIIADDHTLQGLSPGRYTVQVGLYHPDTGQRLPVAGSPDEAVKLAEIEVGE